MEGEFRQRYAHELYRDERDFLCLLTESRFRVETLVELYPTVKFVDTMELA